MALLGDNLRGYWPFSNTEPIFGGGTLTNTNGTTFGSGLIGDAAEFDGAISSRLLSFPFASASTSECVIGDFDLTFGYWIRANAIGTTMNLAGQFDASVGQRGILGTLLNTGVIQFTNSENGTTSSSVNSSHAALTADTWHLITHRFNAAGNNFRGGVNTTFTDQARSAIHASTADLTWGNVAGGTPFNGDMDETFFFKRYLSDDEIVAMYNNGSGIQSNSEGEFPINNLSVIVDPSGRGGQDYTNLNTALTTEATNLIQSNADFQFICRGAEYEPVDVDGAWTADGDRVIKIIAHEDYRHNGVIETSSGVCWINATGSADAVTANFPSFQIDGFVTVGDGGRFIRAPDGAGTGEITVDHMVMDDTGGTFYAQQGVTNNIDLIVKNSAIIDYGTGPSRSLNGTTTVYNCSISAASNALVFNGGNGLIENNNYLHAVGGSNYAGTQAASIIKGSGTATHNTEAINPLLRNVAYTTDNFVSVTDGSEDFRTTQDSILRNNGEDLTSVGITDDIVGTPRPAGQFDVGAFQSEGGVLNSLWLFF